jgi:soluble lytic murein transglycosylase-like protein
VFGLNIFMRICFILIASVLMARAGDTGSTARQVTSRVQSDPRTGRLVRSIVVTPKPVASQRVAETVVTPRVVTPVEPAAEKAAPSSIDEAVEQIAERNSLRPELIHSVIKVESNYNPFAVSPKGALGMMQLIPETARRFGVAHVFNPVENIEGGAKYLKYLMDLFHNNTALALAAYNAGENAVAKYGTVPPYRETVTYLQLVAAQLRKAQAEAAKHKETKETKPQEPDTEKHLQGIVQPDGTVRYVTR